MTKFNTIPSEIAVMRDRLQPFYTGNVDPMIFDYAFFTELESFVKKQREVAKQKLIDYSEKPSDFEGVLIKTSAQMVIVKKSAPVKSFNKDLFMELVGSKYNIDKHALKELAQSAMSEGNCRTTYSVEDIT